jgi:hypothetical protein
MAGPARAFEAVAVLFDQPADAVDDRRFLRKSCAIASEHLQQRSAVHGGS